MNWGEVWENVDVSAAEWDEIRSDLKETYMRIRGLFDRIEDWDDEDRLGGTMSIVVHTVCHLGEIR